MYHYARLLFVITLLLPCFCHCKPRIDGTPEVTNRYKTQSPNLLFTENRGQVRDIHGAATPEILFTAHSGGARIFLSAQGISYKFNSTSCTDSKLLALRGRACPSDQSMKRASDRFTISLEGSSPSPKVIKGAPNAFTENFYTTGCVKGIIGVQTFERIILGNVYPGIDWVLYGTEAGLKYDFLVHPGADVRQIKLRVKDSSASQITGEGALLIKGTLGDVTEKPPVSFAGGKQIATRFVQASDGRISFAVASYDPALMLTIDPSVTWATYYGGSGDDINTTCATDGAGNVYLGGYTESLSGIAAGGYQDTMLGYQYDAFLVKLNAAGSRLWATYYGGENNEHSGTCIADRNNNIYLTGSTNSYAYTTPGGFQPDYGGGPSDAFLVKFDSSGAKKWDTFYGGEGADDGTSCAVDAAGNVYLTGLTSSQTGIASGGFQTAYSGGLTDAFLVKFDSSGNRKWSTYYGGPGDDYAHACAIDSKGNTFIAGYTTSLTDIASGGFQSAHGNGLTDAFLVKFDSTGNRAWGTYYGGDELDRGGGCATDAAGNVYLSGYTASKSGIASGGFQNTFGGAGLDAFLVKFNESGARLWGTYYGGSGYDDGYDCAVDGQFVYLTGSTESTNGIAYRGF